MINLFNGKDFMRRMNTTTKEEYGGYYTNGEMSIILSHKLEEGYKNKELIYTQNIRNIGKTYELIQFAKKYDLNVIVMSGKNKILLKDKYNYDKIYSQEDREIDSITCIVDECVNIELLKQRNINILTGFSDVANQTIRKDKMICNKCNKGADVKDFYLINNKRFHICKHCLALTYDYSNKDKIIRLLAEMDKPFINDVYKSSKTLGEYMRIISMPQYNNLRFRDSEFEDKYTTNYTVGVYEKDNGRPMPTEIENTDIISILDNEIKQLIIKVQEARKCDNVGTYKNLIISLGEVMRLKEKEIERDWQLMYSEYGNKDDRQKQVAVWEQNGDGQIRNHKVWDVKDKDITYKIKPINITLPNIKENELETLVKGLSDFTKQYTSKSLT